MTKEDLSDWISLVRNECLFEIHAHQLADDDGMALPRFPFDRDYGRKLSDIAYGRLPNGWQIFL